MATMKISNLVPGSSFALAAKQEPSPRIHPPGRTSGPILSWPIGSWSIGSWSIASWHLAPFRFLTCVIGLMLLLAGQVKAQSTYSLSYGIRQWTPTAGLSVARAFHTATLLNDGTVLVTGGTDKGGAGGSFDSMTEIYNPVAGTWTATGSLHTGRFLHSATLLADGKVLVTGGSDSDYRLTSSTEIYDPALGTWATTGNLHLARVGNTITLLGNGQVLVSGGESISGGLFSSAELFDPTTGTWSATDNLPSGRANHTATLLPDGTVLVTGGVDRNFNSLASSVLFDPTTGKWTSTGSLTTGRAYHTATRLWDGRVLVTGGNDTDGNYLASSEIYDPNTKQWTPTGSLAVGREYHTATLLANGQVLVTGGQDNNLTTLSSAEVFDSTTGHWSTIGSLVSARLNHTATLLNNGQVLVAGGDSIFAVALGVGDLTTPLSSSELGTFIEGNITGTTSQSVNFGSSATSVTAVANTGYHFVSWSDGVTTPTRTDSNVSGNVNVTANFAINTYTLAYSAGANGTLSGTTTQTVNYASSGTAVTAVPAIGYYFYSWSDGVTTATRTDSNVRGDMAVTANFTSIFYTLSYSAGSEITGSLPQGRFGHTATLLPSGKVLVVGGAFADPIFAYNALATATAEIYDPATGLWSATTSMSTQRQGHTATLLPNGQVLVAGGFGVGSYVLKSAELYDPVSATWTTIAPMNSGRGGFNATLLPSGQVLVVGGDSLANFSLADAELFDPSTGKWTVTGSLNTARWGATATLLNNGQVLLVGGYYQAPGINSYSLNTAEVYDPATGQFTAAGSMSVTRWGNTATRLPNGRVLIAGGEPGDGTTVELYDPVQNSWSVTGSLATTRGGGCFSILLPNGQVLMGGDLYSSGTELYDSSTATWSPGPTMAYLREASSATLLQNGEVLVAGGDNYIYRYGIGEGMFDYFQTPIAGAELLGDAPHGTISGPNPQSVNYGADGDYVIALPDTGYHFVSWNDGNISASRYDLSHTSDVYVSASFAINTYTLSYAVYPGAWITTTTPSTERDRHTATLLSNGQVLVTGGRDTQNGRTTLATSELYDPVSGTWKPTGSLNSARNNHSATLLSNGKVLVTGGYDGSNVLDSSEIYDPVAGTWTTTGSLITGRVLASATSLPNGQVLVTGGQEESGGYLDSAELYNPASGTWSATASMSTARVWHTATLLTGGKVLVTGGQDGSNVILASAELYDPVAGTWTSTGSLGTVRELHTATRLADGRVLVVGGQKAYNDLLASSEIYDPVAGTWSSTGSLTTARESHTATLLNDGQVLVTGGGDRNGFSIFSSSELYNPSTGTWTASAPLAVGRESHVATLLPTGQVLVTGGGVFDAEYYTAMPPSSITGNTSQSVTYGASGSSVTAVPATGYHFVSWSDGVTTATRTDSNVSDNLTVVANFAINTYNLSYTAGTGGTITGSASQTDNYGANGSAVTAVAADGYHFVNWSDGNTNATRTDLDVMANLSVIANFAINTYSLTYDGNGATGGTAPVDSSSPYSANSAVVVLDPGTLTKSDSTFANWNTAPDGSGTPYSVGASLAITANITLYAQWTSVPAIADGSATSDVPLLEPWQIAALATGMVAFGSRHVRRK